MTKKVEEQLENTMKENFKNVRNVSMATGAKAISKVVLDICNEKGNDTIKINKIKRFCETGLGIKR